MKKLLVIALLGLAFASKAQSIAAVAGHTNVEVATNGTIKINGVVRGQITNGVIKNASQVTIGSIENDGTVKNAANVVVGRFMENYDVQNASNVVIGHLRTNLDIKTAAGVKIGTYIDHIPPVWNAVAHFFFNLN